MLPFTILSHHSRGWINLRRFNPCNTVTRQKRRNVNIQLGLRRKANIYEEQKTVHSLFRVTTTSKFPLRPTDEYLVRSLIKADQSGSLNKEMWRDSGSLTREIGVGAGVGGWTTGSGHQSPGLPRCNCWKRLGVTLGQRTNPQEYQAAAVWPLSKAFNALGGAVLL